MAFNVPALDATCFDVFGVAATYTPSGGSGSAVTVIKDENVQVVSGGYSETTEERTVLSMMKSEVANPGRGDTVQIGATTYTLDQRISDDGFMARWAVK